MRSLTLFLLAFVLAATASADVTIAHKYGSTKITKTPQRVVSLGMTDQDSLIALGVVPVGTREWFGNVPGAVFPWAKPLVGKAALPEKLPFEFSYEAIAALNPDVIIALSAALTKEEYETLSKIAPTVAQPGEVADWAISWQAATRTVGTLLGKSAEAEKLIAGVEKKFADARKAHPEFVGKKAQVLSSWGWPNTFYAYASQDARGRLLSGLGFVNSPEVDKVAGNAFGASISRERINVTDLDVTIWMTENAGQEAALRADKVWSQLKNAKEGRAFFLHEDDDMYSAFNFATVLSLPFAIDALVGPLSKRLDGNPATN